MIPTLHPELLLVGAEVPDALPGEPVRPPPSAPVFALKLALRVFKTLLLFIVTAGLWPLYLLGVLVWGWTPNVPRMSQLWRYVGLVLTVRPPAPGITLGARLWLLLSLAQRVAWRPVFGLAWHLDELLYGAALRQTPVVAPLIEISAARSGSTQLARYIEDDPQLAAPSTLQLFFPYLWLWRLVELTLGRVITKEQISERVDAMVPPEFNQRHEGDLFRTDTFDAVIFVLHLNVYCPFLGPQIMVEDFSFGPLAPHNRALWEEDFVQIFDGLGRKTLVYAGPDAQGRPRRLFVKGHFLCAADALERRYPDGRFLTMIREPAPRLQSGVNFLRANPGDPMLGQVPWPWLGAALASSEVDYCRIEQGWFTRTGGARRTVLRFSEYVRDLEAAMRTVYRECLDQDELPPHVPRAHPPRERTRYLLNRSLAQVGVDEAAVNAALGDYIAWCRGEPPKA
ncbi:sulfotransferase [Myxococcota bacterium]|nr:sulfotransferase [Myxococcota bacterium]